MYTICIYTMFIAATLGPLHFGHLLPTDRIVATFSRQETGASFSDSPEPVMVPWHVIHDIHMKIPTCFVWLKLILHPGSLTLPLKNDGWNRKMNFLLGPGLFSGVMLVSGKVKLGKTKQNGVPFVQQVVCL